MRLGSQQRRNGEGVSFGQSIDPGYQRFGRQAGRTLQSWLSNLHQQSGEGLASSEQLHSAQVGYPKHQSNTVGSTKRQPAGQQQAGAEKPQNAPR